MRVLAVRLSVCLSVRLFVCPAGALNSKTKKAQKTKIGSNVFQGKSNRCAIFQLKKEKSSSSSSKWQL